MNKQDLDQIRQIIREEVESTFESKGRVMIREEVESTFESKGRVMIREEVESTFESKGRTVLRDEMESMLDRKLEPVLDKLEALENDVKEIYTMLHDADIPPLHESLSPEKKILKMHRELLVLAKEMNVALPG